MEQRRAYQITERDTENASNKAGEYTRRLAECETHREDKAYWKKRRTTFGLAKRDLSKLNLMGDPEWHRGRGQGIMDALMGLDYSEERLSAAYNAGYYKGYHAADGTGMRGYIDNNPNYAFLMEAK